LHRATAEGDDPQAVSVRMFGRISVLVPTRGRPDYLRQMLASFEATTDGAADLVFRVDDDDHATIEALAGHKTIVGPRLSGYRSMPVFFNELAAAATGDVLLCGNDDMVFRTPGWPGRLLEAANAYPDGLFDLGVTTHNESHYPFSIVSRAVTERLGFLWDVMRAFGRAVMVPSVQIDHDWVGFRPDQVFAESDKDILGTDPTYWSGTHATAVHEAVATLAAIWTARPDLVESGLL
jgi:glycosyltransferase involved in cell wall biosynthesis